MPYIAPAKINLGLHVLRHRADGYRDIETVMLPIGWHDRLTFEPGGAFRFSCSDPALPTDERNLCVRAALTLADRAGVEPQGWLHLDKLLPYGAGLGSGSSDAASTLRLLDERWRLDVGAEVLHELAAALGSDVSFFLHDEAMRASGRGEVLEPMPDAPYRLPFALTVVMPPVHVATAEAYALVEPNEEGRPDLRDLVGSNDLSRWRRGLVNDFEAPILGRYPEIRTVRQRLIDVGAGYAALSGSGAAVFGVFEDPGRACEAAEDARRQGLRAWCSADGTEEPSSM